MNKLSLGQCFEEAFTKQGTETAVTFYRDGHPESEVSFEALNQDANRMVNALKTKDVEKGDRVVLFCAKSLFFVTAHLAIQKMGAVTVPLNPGSKKSEIAYFLHDAKAKLVICEPEQALMIESIDPRQPSMQVDTRRPYQELEYFRSASNETMVLDIDPDDPALIIYTSGTTGKPKGAVLTQRNLVHDAKNIINIWEITEKDVLCHALPLFHIHGLCFALHTFLMAGARILLLDAFSPKTVLDLLSNQEGDPICSVFMAVPAMYTKLLDAQGDWRSDFGHMRLYTSGSAPLLPKHFERIRVTFGKEPVEREGMSETGMNFSNPLQGTRKPGSIGLPLPDLNVRIVDPESFREVARGEQGEIWLKGPGITPGYWGKPEETAETFHDGWFRTGDLGKMDEEGYHYLTDRIKHIIISGGENVSPKEIEAVINRMVGVAESCVVGIPNEKWGEMVAAAVVLQPESKLTPGDVKQECKKHLHDWKCPKQLIFLGELPKNTMGKVLKEEVIAVLKEGV